MIRKVLPYSENINVFKLKSEVKLLTSEKFEFKANKYYISFEFVDLYKHNEYSEEAETYSLTYKKRIESVKADLKREYYIDGEGEEQFKQVEVENVYYTYEDFDYDKLSADIDELVLNHIPYNIEEERVNKITLLSKQCGEIINNGIEFNGKQYSAKLEDQVNVGVLKPLADVGMNVPWHSDGQGCEPFEPEDFKEFSDKLMAHVTYHITYIGGCKDYINSLETKDEVDAFNYGDELPEEFNLKVLENLALLDISL